MKKRLVLTKRNQNKHADGFTLVETLVAITVMLLVVIGPMTVAQKGIQNAYFATERATAVFLAQEALEAVREERDNVALEIFAGGSGYTSDWISRVEEPEGSKLYYDSEAKRYIVDPKESGQHIVESQYVRSVNITDKGSGIAEVEVVVSWDSYIFSGETDKDVILRTWVYDQYSRYE